MGFVIQNMPAGMKFEVDKLIASFSLAERGWLEQKAKQLAASQGPLNIETLRQQILMGAPGGKPASPAQMDRFTTGIIAILIGLLLPAVQKAPEAAARTPRLGDLGSMQQLQLQNTAQRLAQAQQMLTNLIRQRHDIEKNIIENIKA